MDQELLTDTFVDLADTMVADFDLIDFLHLLSDRAVQLLGASAAGVVSVPCRAFVTSGGVTKRLSARAFSGYTNPGGPPPC